MLDVFAVDVELDVFAVDVEVEVFIDVVVEDVIVEVDVVPIVPIFSLHSLVLQRHSSTLNKPWNASCSVQPS